jgi:hypothetical protein
MHFWYSPACGVVVVATPESSIAEKNDLIISGMDAKGRELDDANEVWIDMTLGTALSGSNSNFDWTGIDKDVLENNTWANIKKVISNEKITETEWQVGNLTPSFTINGRTNQARIVDIDSDKVTFMLTSSIGDHNMNAASAEYEWGDNIGGYADSEMKAWLDGEVYNNLDADLKTVISETTITCADGYNNPNGTKSATCYLFLPSIKEVGLNDDISGFYQYMTAIEAEGETFDWFAGDGYINDWFWLRSPSSGLESCFLGCDHGSYDTDSADLSISVYPAFVID